MTTYPMHVISRILERVAAGEALHAICKEPGAMSRSGVYKRINADPALVDAYREARRDATMKRYE